MRGNKAKRSGRFHKPTCVAIQATTSLLPFAEARHVARLRLLVAACVLTLAACSLGPSAPTGDAERGRALFNQPVDSPRGEQQACSRCHAIKEGERAPTGLGTNFFDIGVRAGNTVPGQTAEQYLRTSITDPDAFLAGNFQDGLMYREYAKALTPQQIEDLVAYMLTLKGN